MFPGSIPDNTEDPDRQLRADGAGRRQGNLVKITARIRFDV